MKAKILLLFSVVMIIAGNSIGQITYASGGQTNNCATTAGTSGNFNSFIGCGAGNANASAEENVALGYKALYLQSYNPGSAWSSFNVAIGNYSLYNVISNSTTNGYRNTAVGHKAGYNLSLGSNNVFLGYEAGLSSQHTNNNTFSGFQAGKSNVGSNENIAIGYHSLYSQSYLPVTGSPWDSYNVAVGNYSLFSTLSTSITNGYRNTALGYKSGYSNTTGSDNLFEGFESGYFNATGSSNTLSGFQAGRGTSTSNVFENSSFFGYQAGFGITTGDNNTFTGYQSGYSNTSGANNSFVGYQSGNANTSAGNNTLIGYQAGKSITATSDNVAVGYQALYSQNYATAKNSYNVAVGNYALYANTVNVNTNDGTYNTAVGNKALQLNTTGYWNTACGAGALLSNTTGYYNSAVGLNAITGNTTGTHNTAVGMNAMDANTTGTNNIAIGVNAMDKSTTGIKNTAVGNDALFNAATVSSDPANNNTAFGYQAGLTITIGDNNTCVGYGADVTATSSNRGAFGYNAVNNQGDNTIWLGNSTANAIHVAINGSYNVGSDARFKFNVQEDVKGLEFIKKLRPVTYQADAKKFDDFQIQNMPDSIKTMHQQGMNFAVASNIRQSGFLAQEVDKAAKDCGFASTIISIPADSNVSSYAINYGEIVVPLVKAVQEQQLMIDSLIQIVSQCCAAPQKRLGNTGDEPSGNNGTNQWENVINVELVSISKPVLYQNEPNPFDNSTTIRYYLPENTNYSYVVFYDEMGREIKRIELKDKGHGKIEALTINLATGIYTYSMVVDEKVVETHKMLRNK